MRMHYANIRRVWAFLLVALACAVPAEPPPEAPASDFVTPRLKAKRRTTFACVIDGIEKVVVFSDPPVSASVFPDSWLQLAPEPAADVALQAPLLGFMVANEPAADVAIQAPLLGIATGTEAFPLPPPWNESGLLPSVHGLEG